MIDEPPSINSLAFRHLKIMLMPSASSSSSLTFVQAPELFSLRATLNQQSQSLFRHLWIRCRTHQSTALSSIQALEDRFLVETNFRQVTRHGHVQQILQISGSASGRPLYLQDRALSCSIPMMAESCGSTAVHNFKATRMMARTKPNLSKNPTHLNM